MMVFPPSRGNLKLGEILDSHSAPQPLAASKDLGARRVAGPGLHLHIRTLSKPCQSMKRVCRAKLGWWTEGRGQGKTLRNLKFNMDCITTWIIPFKPKGIPAKEVVCCSPSAPLNERTSRQLGGCGLGFFFCLFLVCFLKKEFITLLQAVRCNWSSISREDLREPNRQHWRQISPPQLD